MKYNSKSRWSVIRRIALLVAACVLAFVLEALAFLFVGETPNSRASSQVEVTIPSGATVPEIAEVLHHAGLVAHPWMFVAATRLMDVDERLQAGQLKLSPGLPLTKLVEYLTQVRAAGVRVVVPEGLTAAQIGGLLQSEAGIDSADFMKAVFDTAFAESLGFADVSLEGYLFPDTYMFYWGMSARRVAMRMAWNFNRKAPESIFIVGEKRKLDRHQIVTLASILQWEVLHPEEWEIVSSVYHNRLYRRMLLQADPTISYILGQGPSYLTLQDLKIDSPYNTYLYKGLPPGPINNPGLRAIRAALQPARTNYLFFVARGDGTHAFSQTANEHLRAKTQAEQERHQKALEDTTKHG